MRLWKDNAYALLAAGITAVATSVTVAAGQGDRFPAVAGPDYFLLTFQNDAGVKEVVKVTARTAGSDVMTIVRAQDGTTAQAWNTNDVTALRLTASAMSDLVTLSDAQTLTNKTLGATVIAENSAAAALRITQIGTGHALLVEDSASPDSTPFVIQADGRVGIGTLSLGAQTQLQALSPVDSTAAYVFGSGSKAVRLGSKGTGAVVQGVDVTGVGSFQPLHVNGSEVHVGPDGLLSLYINSTGQVGIGENTFASSNIAFLARHPGLSNEGAFVFSAGNYALRIGSFYDGGTSIQGVDATGYGSFQPLYLAGSVVKIGTAGNENTTFTSSGDVADVGFGNTAGYGAIRGGGTNAASLYLNGGTRPVYAGIMQYGGAQHIWYRNDYGVEFMRLDTIGRLGLGTTAPVLPASRGGMVIRGNANGAEMLVQSLSATDGSGDGTVIAAVGLDSYLINRLAGSLYLGANNQTALTIGTNRHVTIGQTTDRAYLTVGENSGSSTLVGLFHDTAYGVRLGSNGSAATIEGVDVTGASSYEPLAINGSELQLKTGNTERMRIDSTGRVGVGTINTTAALTVQKQVTGGAGAFGQLTNGQVQSDVTAAYLNAVFSNVHASAAVSTLTCYRASQGTISGTIASQYGFFADSSLLGGTNNYGFYSNIASGAGRWNFYTGGNAQNYFAGDTMFGNPTSVVAVTYGSRVQINGWYALQAAQWANDNTGSNIWFLKSRNATVGSHTVVTNGDSLGSFRWAGSTGSVFNESARIESFVDGTPGANVPGSIIFKVNNGSGLIDSMRITSAGNLVQKLNASVTPANNSEMMVQLTSNTQLTFKVKGTDGTVRSVTLTLA